MLSDIFRPILDPFTAGAGRALVRARLTPNVLTTVGLLAQVAVAAIIVSDRFVLAGIVLIPAVIIDVLDGAAARATGRVTVWGGFYDAVVDRIADGIIIAAIAWTARDGDDRLLAAGLTALILSFLVPYARAKAEAYGVKTTSGPGERAERAVVLILGLILGFVEPALWLIAALSAWTFVSRVNTVHRNTAGR